MPARNVDRGADAFGAALTLAVSVSLFCWGGYRLDLSLDSSPLFLILGAALGLLGGFLHLMRVLAPDIRLFGRRPRDTKGAMRDPSPREAPRREEGDRDIPSP
ncbi:MAG: AtpZ/AtpI family protein [Planctomycetota bacterium]